MLNIFSVYGLDGVMEAVELRVNEFFGNGSGEIGSSDIGACVRAICSDLTSTPFEALSPMEVTMIRNGVYNQIDEVHQ